MKVPVFVLVMLCCFLKQGFAQINSYAKVTAISGTTLTISNVNQTYHTFAVNENVIIMQMQDNVNGDATNASTFGVLGSIASAGLYEVRKITAVTGTSMTLNSALANTYNTGANSSVQVISFQSLGTNFTTTAAISAVPWDGNVGGVVAIRVSGTLTLNHNVSADGAGFRGGATSGGSNGGSCDNTTWITATVDISGNKGEGIYKRTAAGEQYGRAKILNGGGGGNVHNAGGGGGSNVTAGGDGGPGYSCSTTNPSGGQGGIDLSAQISKSRLFMGGGGGGGHQNNNLSPTAGNGGGIIFISATQLNTSGSCTRTISANGTTPGNAGNDGAAGGGAGGSILFDVTTFGVISGCPMTVTANGGAGGTTNDGATHGGGGGGGQGRILYSGANPSNVTTTTDNGAPGCNNNSNPCGANTAGSPSGTNGSGISNNAGSSPLPVSLLHFTGDLNKESGKFELQWTTATEVNNNFFTLERSLTGSDFVSIAQVPGNGTTSLLSRYFYEDKTGFESAYYYRLSQADLDRTTKVLKVIRVERNGSAHSDVWVYPNPLTNSELLSVDLIRLPQNKHRVALIDVRGVEVLQKEIEISESYYSFTLDLTNLPRGVYTLSITSPTSAVRRKVVVR